MHVIDVYLDVVSPYSHLAFERLPAVLEGLSVDVRYRPVLFAGLLRHWGQKGPAEIAPKRDWTYRQVLWLAARDGVVLQMPAAHPFNPLGLLRLAWAAAPEGATPSRWVCEQVLRHAWQGGAVADDPARLAALQARLAPARDPGDAAVKQRLREETDAAAARGVFGVPTFVSAGRSYWGYDALGMLSAALRGDAWFESPAWDEAAAVPLGARRRS